MINSIEYKITDIILSQKGKFTLQDIENKILEIEKKSIDIKLIKDRLKILRDNGFIVQIAYYYELAEKYY